MDGASASGGRLIRRHCKDSAFTPSHAGLIGDGGVKQPQPTRHPTQQKGNPWQPLTEIPSLPSANYAVIDPTPTSATNLRVYQVLLIA